MGYKAEDYANKNRVESKNHLKTTATVLRLLLVQMRSRIRSQLMTRQSSMLQLKKLSAGSTPILQLKRRNTKRSKRLSKVLPHQSYSQWQVQEACQVVCQVECLTWEACLTWVVPEVLLLLLIQQVVQLSKRSTKSRASLACKILIDNWDT